MCGFFFSILNTLKVDKQEILRLCLFGNFSGKNRPATIIVRVGNNRPDLGTNPICNRFTGFLEEGKPLFLPCNPPMPGAFVSVHLESASNQNQLSICETFVYTDQVIGMVKQSCRLSLCFICLGYAGGGI